jgi:hypothetical protein
MVPYLAAHPWISAAVDGALIGLLGGAAFIGVSSLLHYMAEQRRQREALRRCSESHDPALQELLVRPQTPAAIETAVQHARVAFWSSRRFVSGTLWTPRSQEIRPKAH